MSSLFDDEDDDEREDFTSKILETKDDAPLTVESPRPKSPMAEPALLIATPSTTVVAKENIGSSKPAMAEDKGKGPTEIEEAKKANKEETPLGEGPFDQELGARRVAKRLVLKKSLKNKTKLRELAEKAGSIRKSLIEKKTEAEAEDAALQAEVVATVNAKKAADNIVWKICE
ncbi:hypothetical protein ACJX0J_041501 [Zea mays]